MSKLEHLRKALSDCGRELGQLATDEVSARYANSDLTQEEDLTALLCGLLASKPFQLAAGLKLPDTLSVAVAHKQRDEPYIGADLMIAFHSAIPNWHLTTRTLIQAKRVEPGKRSPPKEWLQMQEQIRKMHAHMHACFIIGYTRQNDHSICAFPALSVAACGSREVFDLDYYPFSGFLEGIFCGFIGQAASTPPTTNQSWARHEISIIVEQKLSMDRLTQELLNPSSPNDSGRSSSSSDKDDTFYI